MVNKCIVSSCNSIKEGDGITLHKLPSNLKMQKEWFKAILVKTGQRIFSEDDVICSKHFSRECFITANGVRALKASAIPFDSLEEDEPPLKRSKIDKKSNPCCSVFSCENNIENTRFVRPQLSYHRFPTNEDLLEKWKQFCNHFGDDNENSYVCSDHFIISDYKSKSGSPETKFLKSNAVPSVYKIENATEDQTSGSVDSTEASSSENLSDDARDTEFNKMKCVVQTCQSRRGAIADVQFFPIPSVLNTRRTWLKLIQANTKQIEIPSEAVLCSLHFTPDSFEINIETKENELLPFAIPSIFPKPKLENDEFPIMNSEDFCDPDRGKKFYEWSLKSYQEQKKSIQFLKDQSILQAKRIARLAKSVDDFKAKKFVSEEANNALQNLFDKIVDAQYEII